MTGSFSSRLYRGPAPAHNEWQYCGPRERAKTPLVGPQLGRGSDFTPSLAGCSCLRCSVGGSYTGSSNTGEVRVGPHG